MREDLARERLVPLAVLIERTGWFWLVADLVGHVALRSVEQLVYDAEQQERRRPSTSQGDYLPDEGQAALPRSGRNQLPSGERPPQGLGLSDRLAVLTQRRPADHLPVGCADRPEASGVHRPMTSLPRHLAHSLPIPSSFEAGNDSVEAAPCTARPPQDRALGSRVRVGRVPGVLRAEHRRSTWRNESGRT